MLADGEERGVGIGHDHADEPVAGAELDAPNAARVSTHRPGIRLGKADRHPLRRGEHKLVAWLRDHGVDELVSLAELHGDEPLRPPAAILPERGLLHHPAAGGEHEKLIRVIEAADGAAIGHLLPRLELEDVHEGPPFRVTGELGQLEDPQREHLAERREDEQPVVGAGHEEVLDRILLVCTGAGEPLTAPPLGPVDVGSGPLHVAGPTDRDHHRGLGDELGHVADVARLTADLRPPRVGMLVGQPDELLANERPDVRVVRQHPAKFADLREQVAVLAAKLLLLEVHELPEREPENGVGLHRREAVRLGHAPLLLEHGEALRPERSLEERRRRLELAQPLLRLGLRLRRADDANHLVDVRQRDEQALERVLAGPGLLEEVLCPAAEHRRAVPQKLLEHVAEGEDPRLAVDERQKNQRERGLERRVLVELVEHDVGVGVAFELEDEPHRLLQVALVADRGDALDTVIIDEVGDLLLDRVAGLLIGNLGDDDAVAVLAELLDVGPRPQRDRAPTGEIAAKQGLPTHDDAAGGEVGARDDLEKLLHRDAGVVDELHERAADLAEIVRRDARRHADGDATGAVDDEVRKPARQHDRLGVPLIVGGDEIDGVELEVVEHEGGDRREPCLGVSHRGRGQAGDRAEVALLVDQHVPHVPFLGHADERRIDHALAVRMVVAAGVARDLGALHPGRARGEVEIVHGDENPPLRRLEAVAHVRERPAHDHAHRVREVAILELLFDRELDEPSAGGVDQVTGRTGRTGRVGRPIPGGRVAVPRGTLVICQVGFSSCGFLRNPPQHRHTPSYRHRAGSGGTRGHATGFNRRPTHAGGLNIPG